MGYTTPATPDLASVGNVARASKGSAGTTADLVSFSVKKGDNGGVIVCETYEKKAPAGRRSNSFALGGDYKENPFGPDDNGKAKGHIHGLLSKLGVADEAPPAPGPIGGAPMSVDDTDY